MLSKLKYQVEAAKKSGSTLVDWLEFLNKQQLKIQKATGEALAKKFGARLSEDKPIDYETSTNVALIYSITDFMRARELQKIKTYGGAFWGYSEGVRHDYIITKGLYDKLSEAFYKNVAISNLSMPSKNFFINLEEAEIDLKFSIEDLHTFKRIADGELNKTFYPAAIATNNHLLYFENESTKDTRSLRWRHSFTTQKDVVFRCIGAHITSEDVDEPNDPHSLVKIMTYYENRSTGDVQMYVTSLQLRPNSQIVPEKLIYGAQSLKYLTDYFGARNITHIVKVYSAVLFGISYINHIGDGPSSDCDNALTTQGNSQPLVLVYQKTRPTPLVTDSYRTISLDREGLPESWGITASEESTDKSLERRTTSRTIYDRSDDFYMEPHTRRGFVKRIWVTENHPRFAEATTYEMKELRGITKLRGLIAVEVDSVEINKGKESKYKGIKHRVNPY